MELIEKNPFRILGLSVNASEKEIAKRISDLEIFAEMGKSKSYDSDLEFLSPIDRTPELIKEASQKIEQPKNKFYQSLWWFWPSNAVDELAIDVLQDGNYKKALSLWYDSIKDTEPSIKNVSNYKNLGLLALWLSVKGDKISKDTFENGLKFTGQFMDSGSFDAYQSAILKEPSIYDLEDSTGLFVEDLYKELGSSSSNGSAIDEKDFLNFIKEFPAGAKRKIKDSLISTPANHIEKEIKKCRDQREKNPSKAAKYGVELDGAGTDDVKALKQVLSIDDMEYQMVVDKLAEEILQCSITYFNYHLENNTDVDPGDDAYMCAILAKELAVGQKTKNRIKENLPTLHDWINNKGERQKLQKIEEESSFITNKLNKITSSHETTLDQAKNLVDSCKPKLISFKQKIGKNETLYKDASDAVINVALNIIIDVINNGEKTVIDGLNNLDGNFDDLSLQGFASEYNRASNFKKAYPIINTMDGMNMRTKTRKRFNKNKKIITEAYHKISQDSQSNSQGGCYIATMVYGDYDHPKVKILRKFRDDTLAEYYWGQLFIKLYYKYSPGFVEQVKEYPNVNKVIKFLLEKTLIKWNKE